MKFLTGSFLGLVLTASLAIAPAAFAQSQKKPARAVPVGEPAPALKPQDHTDSYESAYESPDKKVNVRVSPLGLLIGYINVDVDFKITNEWTVGPTLTYWKFKFTDSAYVSDTMNIETYRIGARANWFPNGVMRSGLFVSPILTFARAKVDAVSRATGNTIRASDQSPILMGLVGYHWFWDEGFNLSVGGGLQVATSSSKVEITDGTTKQTYETSRTGSLAIDFMIGYTF